MSDSIHSRPLTDAGRENFDRIFRKTDPVHSLTPGTIREYRSLCCGAEVIGRGRCSHCHKACQSTLTKTNP